MIRRRGLWRVVNVDQTARGSTGPDSRGEGDSTGPDSRWEGDSTGPDGEKSMGPEGELMGRRRVVRWDTMVNRSGERDSTQFEVQNPQVSQPDETANGLKGRVRKLAGGTRQRVVRRADSERKLKGGIS
ncbi:hypothetical protein GHT06_007809 [Daphnia sinensis]|uniref:Uncharacterized protein n=1 Tax=Daphnia sinensis TaxID=1820382 RepID=A0AAD5LJW0_9CRUS|nr:hypothetical protein GHT06_007809 [Daphnia sinensis]